ncbi:MAG: hypothetical protein HY905_02480 [Deltaproteobacteria bacterium]|nr:hypothetical protein [Deltaproteobacteria bacterium]
MPAARRYDVAMSSLPSANTAIVGAPTLPLPPAPCSNAGVQETLRNSTLAPALIALSLSACSCAGDTPAAADGGDTADAGAVPLARRECPGDPSCPGDGDRVFRAAAAVVDITPLDLLEGPSFVDADGNAMYERRFDSFTDADGDGRFDALWIAGFDYGRPAMGVHDPLEARVLALSRNDTTVVLVTADVMGFFHDDILELRERLDPAVSAEVDLLLWSSTHNHEAPDFLGMWGPDETHSGRDPDYVSWIQDRVAAGIADALARLEPATLVHGSIRAEGPAGSQEHLLEDTRDPVVINPFLNVLRLVAADGATTIATVVNYGSHPEELWGSNMQLTADFPHYLRQAVEDGVPGHFDGLGGVCLYVQSTCGGLIGPRHVRPLTLDGAETEPNTFEGAEALGQVLARFALDALDPANGAVAEADPELRFRSRELLLRVDNYAFQAAFLLGVFGRALYDYDPDYPFDDNNVPDIVSEVVYLRVGESSMITVPGESTPELFLGGYDGAFAGGYPLVQPDNPNPPDISAAPAGPYLRDLVAADGSRFQWLIGLAQDEVGYLLPPYDYQLHPTQPYIDDAPGDHYEETNSLGPRAVPDILEALGELLAETW